MIAQILRRAAAIIRQEGLYKTDPGFRPTPEQVEAHKHDGIQYRDHGHGPCCALVAIERAAGGPHEPACNFLRTHINNHLIANWSDRPEQTTESVASALEAAAEKAPS